PAGKRVARAHAGHSSATPRLLARRGRPRGDAGELRSRAVHLILRSVVAPRQHGAGARSAVRDIATARLSGFWCRAVRTVARDALLGVGPKVLFERAPGPRDRRRDRRADEAMVPCLEAIAGHFLFSFRIAQDKTVLSSVLAQPRLGGRRQSFEEVNGKPKL